MKKALALILQFLLFFLADLAGSFAAPFRLRQVLSTTTDGTHVFLWDGLLIAALLLVVILVIEQLRRRLAAAASWTLAAFVLAVVAGLALKFGFMTV